MSRILYLDTFSGISGDMFLGALVDAGLRLEDLVKALKGLPLSGYEISTQRVHRGPFHATRLRVHVPAGDSPVPGSRERPPNSGQERPPHPHSHGPSQPQGHGHTHGDSQNPHSPGSRHTEGHRHLSDILDLLERSTLPESVRHRARRVFERLGQAEAKVHGIPVEAVHFHEVGAVDSIVDIVGSCLALQLLGVDSIWSSPLTLGTGFARGAHGTFPIPSPATLEILRGFPVRQRETCYELTTPTGAALASTLSDGFGPMPPVRLSIIGYGAGNDRPGEVPNVLRVVLGESRESPERDRVLVLETHLDDMNPQWLGYLMDRLLGAGALDVTITPILMKKSRSAHKVTVLARPGTEGSLEDILFRETTTFGLRKQEVDRVILARHTATVSTPWGEVRVKVGSRGGQPVCASPEYEDLKAIASRHGVPLREVHDRVLEIFYSEPRQQDAEGSAPS